MAGLMISSLKEMIDMHVDQSIIEEHIAKCVELYGSSKQNKRGITTLLIRYYIDMDMMDKVTEYLYMDDLMKRDYLAILDYIYAHHCNKAHSENDSIDTITYVSGVAPDTKITRTFENGHFRMATITYIYSRIDIIETKDVDRMIDNKWFDLLKRFDGYPVMTSYDMNHDGSECIIYEDIHRQHITKMMDTYVERIEVKDSNKELVECMKDVDIIIDGANMSYVSGQFKPNELVSIVKMLERMKYRVKIVFHPTRQITIPFLQPYIIYTPKFRNDDDYLIYGMLKFSKMVLTNDLFRDHVKNMDVYTKCYVESKTIRYFKKNLIIPRYSKCIQVKDNGIYIPSVKGCFYFLPSISASTPPPNNGAA